VTRNGGASPGGLNSPLRVTHPLRKDVSPVCWGTPLGHQTRPPSHCGCIPQSLRWRVLDPRTGEAQPRTSANRGR
jgi:hypothetical protein